MPPNPPADPLPESAFFILLSLAAGPRHGYAVLKDIEEISRGKVSLSVSTLYTTLGRLQDQDLIERSDNGDGERDGEAGPGLPRKVYRLTQRGAGALDEEARRLQVLLSVYRQRFGEESR